MQRMGTTREGEPCMRIYMAPMEGLTTYIFRNTYAKYFGGIDRYYTPFLSSLHLSSREREDILPEHNEGLDVVPQILTNRPEEFLTIAKTLQEYGYQEVNLNLGCPSGTVVAKHRGSGMLTDTGELNRFLDALFTACPLAISVKTRIGIFSESEWEEILEVYGRFPIKELIIHTRLQKDFYREPVRPHTFLQAKECLGNKIPLCYNGDIVSMESLQKLQEVIPDMDCIMLGRGLVTNPDLTRELREEKPSAIETYRAFVEELFAEYHHRIQGGDRNILYKMKEVWVYLGNHFPDSGKHLKKMKKASTVREYELAVNALFRELTG